MAKQLTLRIKRQYFIDILRGTKKSEYRDVKPTTSAKLIYFVCDGKIYKREADLPKGDITIDAHPIPYATLQLINGYAADAPRLVVEVKSADFYILADEDGNDITYDYKGEVYLAAQVEYHLGRIVSTDHLTPEMAEALASRPAD